MLTSVFQKFISSYQDTKEFFMITLLMMELTRLTVL